MSAQWGFWDVVLGLAWDWTAFAVIAGVAILLVALVYDAFKE